MFINRLVRCYFRNRFYYWIRGICRFWWAYIDLKSYRVPNFKKKLVEYGRFRECFCPVTDNHWVWMKVDTTNFHNEKKNTLAICENRNVNRNAHLLIYVNTPIKQLSRFRMTHAKDKQTWAFYVDGRGKITATPLLVKHETSQTVFRHVITFWCIPQTV